MLSVVHHTITAAGKFAVVTAAVRLTSGLRGVGVAGCVIALLFESDGGHSGQAGLLHSSISALAIRKLRQIVDELFDERICLSVSVEENGDDNSVCRVSVGVDELKFKIESFAIDQMFRWGVEDELLQIVEGALVKEGITIRQVDFTSEVVSSIHDVETGDLLVTNIESVGLCIAKGWSGGWDVHWGSSAGRRAQSPSSTHITPVSLLGIIPSARAVCGWFGAW